MVSTNSTQRNGISSVLLDQGLARVVGVGLAIHVGVGGLDFGPVAFGTSTGIWLVDWDELYWTTVVKE